MAQPVDSESSSDEKVHTGILKNKVNNTQQQQIIQAERQVSTQHPLASGDEVSPASTVAMSTVTATKTTAITTDTSNDVANNSEAKSPVPSHSSTASWTGLHNWIHSLCIVTFDIELGQAIELVFPEDVILSDKEKSNICYLSFPDSNSGCMGDTQYFFRTRYSSGNLPEFHSSTYNENCLVSLESDSSFLYGFVYFRQIKDRAARRGYLQKSLVLLTHLPLISLFKSLVSLIANEFFDSGSAVISVAAKEINTCWPLPAPGSLLSLNLMGSVVQVKIPHKDDSTSTSTNATVNNSLNSVNFREEPSEFTNDGPCASSISGLTHSSSSPSLLSQGNVVTSCLSPVLSSSPCIVISSAHEVNLFKAFFPVMTHMQSLWELVLTCEPLLVMASAPDVTCEVVAALVSSIWPLKCSSDYRPFFTIHDSEFKEFTSTSTTP